MTFSGFKRYLRRLLWQSSRYFFAKLVVFSKGQKYSIGILQCNAHFEFETPLSVVNPVLSCEHITDMPAGFVADPFMIRRDDRWYMFFEAYSLITRLGEIGLAESGDGHSWEYKRIVLSEPFHLAYPHVFVHEDEVLMIPDSPGNSVRLYRAKNFPDQWEFITTIVQGNRFSDSSVFYYANQWWMFTAWRETLGTQTSLRLFGASQPQGPWTEHCKSPLTHRDNSASRPAGRVSKVGENLIRFAQDAVPNYGSRVRAFKITELCENNYREQELNKSPILEGSGSGWNASGMHHLDMHEVCEDKWLACVDGWVATGGYGAESD